MPGYEYPATPPSDPTPPVPWYARAWAWLRSVLGNVALIWRYFRR